MFGRILSITEKEVVIENLLKRTEASILGVHIVFEYNGVKIIGEINEVTETKILACFVGEIINNEFIPGLINKPSINSLVRIIYKNEVPLLMGNQSMNSVNDFYVGKSTTYPGFNVSADMNEFFSSHFAIIGNTGSGKSSCIASIIQHLFYRTESVPVNSNIVVFDVYGEYAPAFNKINEMNNVSVKYVTTRRKFSDGEIVKIPPYLLETDDYALLLGAEDPTQIPIIEKALKLAKIFTDTEEKVIEEKNYILSTAVLDILSSGRTPTQIRDQVIAVLTKFNTRDINLESKIVQPGYIRTLKQCLAIDVTGKINTMQLVVEFLEPFTEVESEHKMSNELVKFTLQDLYNAFEFALISEGILKSDRVFDRNNILKVRLGNIIQGEESAFFEIDELITKDTFVKRVFTNVTGGKAQIVNINLNYIDERFAKILTKIYSKLFFEYSVSLETRGSYPVHIILEEAHRYVQNDNDINVIGYNIFDRITKEGRKYGVLLGLITQRPSELSNTALSQCSNFIVFRMFHPEDIKIISTISYNLSDNLLSRLKILRPGIGIAFGTSFKISTLVKIDMPSPPPESSNVDLSNIWINK